MQTLKFDNREDWLEARRGKITGSRLKDIVVKRGLGRKVGFYELIAERIAIPANDENPMDRGTRLETEAIDRFAKEYKKKVDKSLVIWQRDDNDSIAISPDGFIGTTEAVECKCLASARHIEAYLEKKIPDEYEFQKIQYFIVNEKLKTTYWVFYDPRIPSIDMFVLEIKRSDIEEEIQQYLDYQRSILEEVDTIVNQLTF